MFFPDKKDLVIEKSINNRLNDLLNITEPECKEVLCGKCVRYKANSPCSCAQLAIFIETYTNALFELHSSLN